MKALRKYFYPTELISFAYILLTALFISIFSCKIDNAPTLLLNRLLFAALIVFVALIDIKKENKILALIRHILAPLFILYWYPETYYMNECIFPNLDHIFLKADDILFGCQPALEFSKQLPARWFSELMNFGYCSYYLMIAFAALYFYYTNNPNARKILFIILCSFFIHYIIFIILPVVGPQFYYPAIGLDAQVPDGYLFRKILMVLQTHGEKPTGAFPSSHVSICIVCMVIIYKYARRYFVYFLPVAVILILSTVYIKAHYLIDVIGGFISAPLAYWLSVKCWNVINKWQLRGK